MVYYYILLLYSLHIFIVSIVRMCCLDTLTEDKCFVIYQVRRFFRSMKRFSNPLRRLDTIARDADLRDKPIPELKRLAETILEKCTTFMQELEKQALLHPEKQGMYIVF